MSFFVFQHASFTGAFSVFASTTRILRHWRRLRNASRKSRLITLTGGFCAIPVLQMYADSYVGFPVYIVRLEAKKMLRCFGT